MRVDRRLFTPVEVRVAVALLEGMRLDTGRKLLTPVVKVMPCRLTGGSNVHYVSILVAAARIILAAIPRVYGIFLGGHST